MRWEIVFPFLSLFLFLVPITFLERSERRKNTTIKRGGYVSKEYQAFDWLFIFALLGTLVYLAYYRVPSMNPILVFATLINVDMFKTGLYAGITGNFPYRTRGGIEYFYTDYENVFSRQRLTVKSLGLLSALSSFIFMIFAALVL